MKAILIRRLPALLAAALLLLAPGCGSGGGAGSDQISQCNLDTFTPNYARNVSHLLTWPSFPVTVFFTRDANYTDTRRTVALSGFSQWNTATGGDITFNEVSSSANAQIVVAFDPTTQDGLTVITYGGLTVQHADMHLGVKNQADVDLKAIAAHEFGHALGIDGHSDVVADLMYPIHYLGTVGTITARDLNTMKTGYCTLFSRGACCSGSRAPTGPTQTKVLRTVVQP